MSIPPTIESLTNKLNTEIIVKSIVNSKDRERWKALVERLTNKWKASDVTSVKECAIELLLFKPKPSRLSESAIKQLQNIVNGDWRPKKNRPQSGRGVGSNRSGSSRSTLTREESDCAREEETSGDGASAGELDLTSKLLAVHESMAKIMSTMRGGEQTSAGDKQKKHGDSDSIVDTIIGQTESILSTYMEVKSRCDNNHVDHSIIKERLAKLCKVLNVDINAHTMPAEETISKLVMQEYVRVADVQAQMTELYRGVTSMEYKRAVQPKKGQGLKYTEKKSGDFKWFLNDMEDQLKKFMQTSSTENSDTIRNVNQDKDRMEQQYQEMQNRHTAREKRVADVQARLKAMSKRLANREYEGEKKKGNNNKFDESHGTDEWSVIIEDMEQKIETLMKSNKESLDSKRKANQEMDRLEGIYNDLQQRCNDNHVDHNIIMERLAKLCKVLNVDINAHSMPAEETLSKLLTQEYVRVADVQAQMTELYRGVTSLEYKRTVQPKKGQGQKYPDQNSGDFKWFLNDMEDQLLKFMQKSSTKLSETMRNVNEDKDRMEQQYKEMHSRHTALEKRVADVQTRLKTMFKKLANREYMGEKKKRSKGNKVDESNDTDELSVIIEDMEQKLETIMQLKNDELEKSHMEIVQARRWTSTISDTDKSTYEDQADEVSGRKGCRTNALSDEDKSPNKEQSDEVSGRKKDRLSTVVTEKLSNISPDIADLSDADRPTKIAEQYSELYDNEWTDAYDILTRKMGTDDVTAIATLLGYLTNSYTQCLRHSEMQELLMEGLVVLPATVTSKMVHLAHNPDDAQRSLHKKIDKLKDYIGDVNQKRLSDLRKQTRRLSVEDVVKAGLPIVLKDKKDDAVKKYVAQCLRLCWIMCQQQPRVYIDVEVTKYQGPFDRSLYREYMKKGKKVEYVVWPPLYLQEGGSILCKGVANGK